MLIQQMILLNNLKLLMVLLILISSVFGDELENIQEQQLVLIVLPLGVAVEVDAIFELN